MSANPQILPIQAASVNAFFPLKKLCLTGWIAFAALLFHTTSLAQAVQAKLPTQTLYAGMHRVEAELAVTPDQRSIGLMGRREMTDNQGMLFVFEQASPQCFWMMQTFIPLSIAFIRDDGTITNIEHMQPLTRNSHCSSEPVRLALEVNQGWFEKRNIKPGMQIRGIPALNATR